MTGAWFAWHVLALAGMGASVAVLVYLAIEIAVDCCDRASRTRARRRAELDITPAVARYRRRS